MSLPPLISKLCLALLLSALAVSASAEDSEMTLFDLGRKVSDEFGYTIIFSPKIRSSRQIVIYGSENLSGEELYQVFLDVLELHNYAAVRDDNLIRVIRSRRARTMPIPVIDSN